MNWLIAFVVIVGLLWYRVSVEPERKAQEAQMIEQLARNSAEQAYVEAIAAGARSDEAMLEARRTAAMSRANWK